MNKGGKFMLENITIDNIFSKTSKWFTKDRKIIFIVTHDNKIADKVDYIINLSKNI